MKRLLLIALLVTACGPSDVAKAWCKDNQEYVFFYQQTGAPLDKPALSWEEGCALAWEKIHH